MPKRSDAVTATIEAPRASPESVAEAAAQKSESLRRDALVADWRAWREIVASLSSGCEPDGKQLAEIAELASRLRLPEGALANAVRAVSNDRELRQHEENARARMDAAADRQPLLTVEIDAARRRLDELLAEQRQLASYPLAVAAAIRAVAENRSSNPLVFLPEAELAERAIRSVSRALPVPSRDEEGWSV